MKSNKIVEYKLIHQLVKIVFSLCLLASLICLFSAIQYSKSPKFYEKENKAWCGTTNESSFKNRTFASEQQEIDFENGKLLFRSYCASCHYPNSKKMVGPGLKGFRARWQNDKLLYAFIRNSQAVIKSGNPYAVALFDEYGRSVMPPQDLSDKEIKDILFYLEHI